VRTPAAADPWKPVSLVSAGNARGRQLLVPKAAAAIFNGEVPGWLLIRSPGADKPVVARAELVEGVAGETAIKASAQMLARLNAPDVTYPAAEVRRASVIDRLRYDRSAWLAGAVIVLSVLAAVWGAFEAVSGNETGWKGIVGAVITFVLSVLSIYR
jgi:hypothetical protein